MKYIKNKNSLHVTLLNYEYWSIDMACFTYNLRWHNSTSFFNSMINILFLDVSTLKLRIAIIILPKDRHDIILPTALTTNN